MMDICRLTSDDQPDSIKMVEIDFQALCRICGALGENLTSVFGKRAADRLRERIDKYLQIEILAEDCLPTKVCDGCRETLDRFHELYEKCHRTDEKFRTMMSSAEELKDTVVEEVEDEEEYEEEAKQVMEEEVVEKEEEVEEEVPAAKKTKETKRDSKQDEVQEVLPEKHGRLLRHSIRIVSIQSLNEEFHEENQFLEEQSEEEEVEPQFSALGRAQIIPLSRELVEQGKVVVDGKTAYKCAECGKEMASPYTYQAHLRIHSGERPFPCPHCSQMFRISQGLARHVREVHEKVRNYFCEICGKRFGNGRNLKEHRFLHTNEKPYSCDICGNSYKQKASLHMHKRTHEINRSFKCSVCSRSFYTRAKLQLHETTHSDERAYECDACGQSFRTSHNLARHRKCHELGLTFQCPICEAMFKQKRYLMKHLKKQHQWKQDEHRKEIVDGGDE